MKAAFYTLGCKVNQYETQAMQTQFAQDGYEIVPFSETADVYVVNSCAVTAEGERKSRQVLHRARRQNPAAVIVLCGCAAQSFPERALALDEPDVVCGTTDRLAVPALVRRARETGRRVEAIRRDNRREAYEPLRIDRLAERTRAFVKIEDGCDRFCAYCIVPYARGNVRSRPLAEIRAEAARLAANGYREIVLVGINLSAYGTGEGTDLADAAAAASLDGALRVRFGSLEPDLLTDAMIARLRRIPGVCRHFHLSLQSGCAETLRRMRRVYGPAEYRHVVQALRAAFPGCAVTTDILVGFPGETEQMHAEALAFVREMDFADAHIFAYSRRAGTLADRMPDQVPPQVKKRRAEEMEAAVAESRRRWLASFVGSRVKALFLEQPGRAARGLTDNNLTVRVETEENLQNKEEFVIITRYTDSECIAERCEA